ncbi:hypothetical protein AB0M94_33880 [Streptomyces xanthochromogenes]|uniref:hypothetical protein n=1 Tax=Streptomyces TaxID=1883 RepID=UPI001371695D|nr:MULTISPECIES: hypothetical protein [unclassified Streptomyces]MYV95793.1 hypothetical protein [Streptomyces sp. SID1034]
MKIMTTGVRRMVLAVAGVAILGLAGTAVAHAGTQWGGTPQPVVTEVAHPQAAPVAGMQQG